MILDVLSKILLIWESNDTCFCFVLIIQICFLLEYVLISMVHRELYMTEKNFNYYLNSPINIRSILHK